MNSTKAISFIIIVSAFMLYSPSAAIATDITSNLKVDGTLIDLNRKGETRTEKLVWFPPDNDQLMLDKLKGAGTLQMGVKWKISYAVTGGNGVQKKERSCEVTMHSEIRIKAHLFDTYEVNCVVETIGKKKKRYSTTWYDSETLHTLWVIVGDSPREQN